MIEKIMKTKSKDMDIREIQGLLENPGKSETHDDIEATIADQMRRFTIEMETSTDAVESLKILAALGMDLAKTCGMRVCEDTSMTLSHIIRKHSYDLAYKFQQISSNCNNNDICVYLYLALPTIGHPAKKATRESLTGMCLDTIDKIADAYGEIGAMTNFGKLDRHRAKDLYLEMLLSR